MIHIVLVMQLSWLSIKTKSLQEQKDFPHFSARCLSLYIFFKHSSWFSVYPCIT